MVKRGKLEIMKDILSIIYEHRTPIKPTPLLRKSGLSTAGFKEYYIYLIQRQLINEINKEGDKEIILTNKGQVFLEKYKTIINFIDEFSL